MLGLMPRRPDPLPDSFRGRPFTVAAAERAGITRSRTRAKDLASPAYGVRVPADVALTLAQRCVVRAAMLPPDAVFSHLTAAALHHLPLPLSPRDEDNDILDISVTRPTRAPRGKGIRGHHATFAEGDVDRRWGVAATSPIRTFCDLAGRLELAHLVALGDALVRRDFGLHTREELARALEQHPGRRHVRRLRRAVELLDEDSESPKESELRVVIIEAGLPAPRCQESVFDEHHRFVARIDLTYPHLRIAIEYEGDHHREKQQWRKDLARRRRLEALGWVYLSVTQADLDNPTDVLADLQVAIAARTGAPASRDT